MSLISVQTLSCSQGAKTLFNDISFTIEANDKIALVGVNGCGKTTLLTQIADVIDEPISEIATQQSLKITKLHQSSDFDPTHSIHDHLFTTHSDEDWEYASRVISILRELHITDLDQKMGTLSGGMIKKIALAQLFFEDTDLLILDEPTNHLDIETIDWLEKMLRRMNCALLMVTHDRYFLDKICNKILEIDQQSLFIYRGNYQSFLEQRDVRYQTLRSEDQTVRSILRVELEWLKRGPKARSTKQKARKDRIDTLVNRKSLTEDTGIELAVSGRRLGKKILELKNISKSFDKRIIIRDFSYSFKESEKIGILGPNGAGKTTLFNIITEHLEPDSGELDTGVNTVFGYFDQHSMDFDLSLTILQHIKSYGTHITMHDGTQLSATKLLERFLFPTTSFNTAIGKLSGGERRRLHLVCLLLTNPNFLLFDEPTNDLDIMTLSVLEDFLINFAGCVIIISHDRYFLDRVADHLLICDGKGNIERFWGTYSDYAQSQKEANATSSKSKTPSAPTPVPPPEPVAPPKRALSYKEQQELKKLETEIATLESEKKDLTAVFSSATATNDAYTSAGKRLFDIAEILEKKIVRWEELAELA